MYANSSYSSHNMDTSGNFEMMPLGASGQMAKVQLQRHTSNSSSIPRRRTSRVTKPTSTGNSPQSFQRRRATTQNIPRHRTSLYQQCLQPSQSATETSQQQSMPRPVSWHPSTLGGSQQRPFLSYEIPLQSYYPSYATYNINGIPTPMTQPELVTAAATSPFQPMDYPSGLYQQSKDYEIQNSSSSGLNTLDNGYINTSYSYGSPLERASEGYPVFSPMPYPTSAWTNHMLSLGARTAPPTPDLLPIQNHSEKLENRGSDASSLPRKDSKELVGMGLYDGPDRNSWSLESMLDGPTSLISAHRPESTGKGLKLEETWEPPEEDDETDGEEQDEEMEDDGDQEREVQTVQELEGDEEMFRLAEGALGLGNQGDKSSQRPLNMSNRSFFFESDDSFPAGFSSRNLWQGEIADYCVR